MQDAWLRASRAELPAGPRARPWLARVMRNLARDARRGERRRRRRERLAARPEALAPSDDELELAVERQERLVAWVRELDAPFRRVVLLRWFEGLSPSEIAARDGLPLATVRSRLRRAHERLRERVERESGGRREAWLAALAAPVGLRGSSALAAPLVLMNVSSITALSAALLLALSLWAVLHEPARVEPSHVESAVEGELAQDADAVASSERGTERRAAIPANDVAEPPAIAAAPAEPPLVLRVVDASGRPVAGVPVALFRGAGDGSESPALELVTAGPLGEARIEEPIAAFAEIARVSALNGGRSLHAGLAFPGADLPRVPIDTSDPPREPVVLALPPTGALVVRLRSPDGTPLAVETWLHATPLYEHPTEASRKLRGTRYSRYLRDESEASFPHVGPGLELRVEVQDFGLLCGHVVDVAGPERPGETRTVELMLGDMHRHVRGRLVDPAGAPVEARWMDADFEPDGDERGEVDPDGRFTLSLARWGGTEGPVEARVAVDAPSGLLVGAFVAALPPEGEGVDVGDVVLRPASTIAAGRVVDADGAPVERATHALYEKFDRRADPEDFRWNFAGVPYAYTDADGRFVVRGELEPGEYAIRALADGWIDRGAVRFEAGARGLELVLDPAQSVTGTLRLPEGVAAGELRLTAVYEGATREERAYASWRAGVEPDGDFRLTGLRPRAVTLRLHLGESDEVLASIDDVPTAAAGEPGDARVRPWDLTRRLVPLDLEVRLAAPGPAAYVATDRRAMVVRDGRCRWVLTDEVAGITVGAPGHVSATLDPRALPESVLLERGPAVRVTMRRALPAVPEGWWIEATLDPQDEAVLPDWLADEDGNRIASLRGPARYESVVLPPGASSWTVHACAPGPHRITWWIVRPPDDPALGSSRASVVTTSTGRYDVDVPPSGDALEVVRDFDLERMRAAIESLR